MAQTAYSKIPELLGWKGDETVWIASDLSRLALAAIRNGGRFDPEAFLGACLQSLPQGTVLIPGFRNQYRDGDEISFETLRPDTGGLSTTAFKLYRKGHWLRTSDPVHSFFVKGEKAGMFLGQTERSTFGPDSAFALLRQLKGKFVAIDIPLRYSFTFAHYIEEQMNVPYRAFRTYRFKIEGQNESWKVYEKKKGYDIRLDGLLPLFQRAGAAQTIQAGGVPVVQIDLEQAATIIEDDIRQNHARNLITFDLKLYLKQLIKSIR